MTEKDKRHINFGKKSNSFPLTGLFSNKRNNYGSVIKSPSAYIVLNTSNKTTEFFLPPLITSNTKPNVHTCEGIFAN